MQSFYPQFDSRALRALATIKTILISTPDYLESDGCPYDVEDRKLIKQLLAKEVIEVEKIVHIERQPTLAERAAEGGGKRGPRDAGAKTGDIDRVSVELQAIMDDLRNLKLNAKDLKPADKIQVIKTQAALLEKMITMTERATNIKKVSNFMSIVMGILDDAMTDEQRQIFMKRLEPFTRDE